MRRDDGVILHKMQDTPGFIERSMAARVVSVYPGVDVGYVENILCLNTARSDVLTAADLAMKHLKQVLLYQKQSLDQFYQTLLASMFLTHPLEPPADLIGDRFLFVPLAFTMTNVHVVSILSTRRWWMFGNLSRYLSLDAESVRYVARCRPLLTTHVLFEYISNTRGVLHVLPDRIRANEEGVFSICPSRVRLPFEYTFHHTLHYTHFNYSYSQHRPQLRSLVDQIMYHAQYPIGRSIGTFYRAANGKVVLVSPSVRTVGYLVSDSDLKRIEEMRCSLVNLAPGTNPCEMILSTIQTIPNPDNRPSYIVVADQDLSYWAEMLGGDDATIHLRSFSSLGTQPIVAHVMVVDNANQLSLESSYAVSGQCRHLLCLSPCVTEHLVHLTRVCGLHSLPFPPLEAARDLCLFQTMAGTIPCPTIRLIAPEQRVSRAHESQLQVSAPGRDYLLRLCAGGSVATMTECTTVNGVLFTDEVCPLQAFGIQSDPCMVCLSTAMVDPVILPCRHLLCTQCMQSIAQISTTVPLCPSCRSPVGGPVMRPHWVERKMDHVRSKQVAVEEHVLEFLMRPFEGPLCIMTAYKDVADTYLCALRKREIKVCTYGFGCTSMLTDEVVVICSISAYDRYMHGRCVEIVMSDIGTDAHSMANVLRSQNRRISVCLMQGCLEERIFHQWCTTNP